MPTDTKENLYAQMQALSDRMTKAGFKHIILMCNDHDGHCASVETDTQHLIEMLAFFAVTSGLVRELCIAGLQASATERCPDCGGVHVDDDHGTEH